MMQGPFGNLILQLQQRIRTQVTAIREVSEDRGQIDSYETRPPVAFPCVLIDFDFKFDDLGENVQWGEGEVVIRLAFPPFSSSSSLMPASVREKGMAYLDYEYKLVRALHGWQPTAAVNDEFYFQDLSRRSATTERRNDTLRVRELRFATALQDNSTAGTRTLTQLTSLDILIDTEEREGIGYWTIGDDFVVT